jgi:hypothetical protein
MKAKLFRKRKPVPRLQKWKKNGIFKAMKEPGLDPREFDLDDSAAAVRIKHKWSESCFSFDDNPGHYVGHRVVGDGPDWGYDAYSWEALLSRVNAWADEVKHDLATPDLWAEIQREVKLLGVGSDDVRENTPFTPNEQKEIARRYVDWTVGGEQSLRGADRSNPANHPRRNPQRSDHQIRYMRHLNEFLVAAPISGEICV